MYIMLTIKTETPSLLTVLHSCHGPGSRPTKNAPSNETFSDKITLATADPLLLGV